MSTESKRFTISIPQAEIDRLDSKLRSARHPVQDVVPGAGKDYGFETQWAKDLYDYWLNDYSWPKAQQRMNSAFLHYTTEIEDLNIHYIHELCSTQFGLVDARAIPLLLIHGWPGSFHEFSEIIPHLARPDSSSIGGFSGFNCVAPSLPGFCFSDAPRRKRWTVKDTARVFHSLMLRLGYKEYCVQAGDWGQFVARELGAQYSDACKVIHLNYCPGSLPPEISETDLTYREKACGAKGVDWRTNHVGYAVLMRTRPHTIGWMLQDNPLGLLAFVGEKYDEAANPAVQSSQRWKDHILTTVCLYYFTSCIASSALIYYENVPHHEFATYAMQDENLIKCPFGYTSCWYDTAPNSERAVRRTGNLVFYRERDETGHFACLEDPRGLAEDIRELVRQHWDQ